MSNFLVAVFGLIGFDAALDSAVRDTPSYHRAVAERHALVRLRVRTNSGVEVPIGQSTGCP